MMNMEISQSEIREALRSLQRARRKVWDASVAMLLVVFAMATVFFWGFQDRESDILDSRDNFGMSEQMESSGSESTGSSALDPSMVAYEGTPCHTTVYQCVTDRIGHWTPLGLGHALCNAQYRFGITPQGVFQWHDCETDETRIIFDPSDGNAAAVSYFQTTEVGALQVYDSSKQLLFEKIPTLTITPTTKCLHRPALDCPYLHLHKSGDVVLNSVNANGWSDRKIQKCFDNLWN